MRLFFSYVLLGLSLAAPIGPVNAAQMDKGIKHGFLYAWYVGLGATVADIVYMIIVYIGLVQFIQIPIVQAFLWLFGAFVLFFTGYECLILAVEIDNDRIPKEASLSKSFLTGFVMSITNPLTILFWLGIYGSVIAKTATAYQTNELLLYSFAIILGLVIWDITMAVISSSFRKFLSVRKLALISKISGVSLICFGLYFAWHSATMLFT